MQRSTDDMLSIKRDQSGCERVVKEEGVKVEEGEVNRQETLAMVFIVMGYYGILPL